MQPAEPGRLIPVNVQQQFLKYAEVAHLVEHDLAKVGVAGSSPVFRSAILLPFRRRIFYLPSEAPFYRDEGAWPPWWWNW